MNASPATVSRAGIIFVSDTDLDWSPVVEGWILKRPAAEQPVLKELFSRFYSPHFYLVMLLLRHAPNTCTVKLSFAMALFSM